MCCSSCKRVRYCSKSCQKINWSQHKAECKHLTSCNQFHSRLIDDITIVLRVIWKLSKSFSSDGCGVCKLENSSVTCCETHVHNLSCTPSAFDNDTLLIISTVCKFTKQSIQNVSRLLFQCRSNNFGITDDLLTCVGVGMYPHAALLNHSCDPNCVLRYSLLSSGPVLQVCLSSLHR
jgi:SET and MYND domain-containing protein